MLKNDKLARGIADMGFGEFRRQYDANALGDAGYRRGPSHGPGGLQWNCWTNRGLPYPWKHMVRVLAIVRIGRTQVTHKGLLLDANPTKIDREEADRDDDGTNPRI